MRACGAHGRWPMPWPIACEISGLRHIRTGFKPALTKTWPAITIFSLRAKFPRHSKWPHILWLTSLCVRKANERMRRRCMSAQNSLESFFVLSFRFFSFASHAHTHPHASTIMVLLNFLSRHSLILRCYYYYYSRRSVVDVELILFLFRFALTLFPAVWSQFFNFISLIFFCARLFRRFQPNGTRTHTHARDSTPIPNLRTHTHTRAAVGLGTAHTAKKCIHEFDEDKNVARRNGRNRNNVIWLAKRDEEQTRPHDTVGGGRGSGSGGL